MRAQTLMGGIHVTESGRFHEHAVPGGVGPVRVGQVFEREIRRQPRRVFEIMQRRYAFDQVRRQEGGAAKMTNAD